MIKLIDFLKRELEDKKHFSNLDLNIYETNSDQRRNVERWVENIVNCSLDIAKILLASEKKPLPDTYKEMLRLLCLLPGFKKDTALKLAQNAQLRNFLAYEYLDLRFCQIQKFIQDADCAYKELIDFTNKLLRC